MPSKIAVYGVFGVGNVGNDESGRVMIELLRRRHPEAQVFGLSGGADAADDLGVPVVTLTRSTTGRRTLVTRVLSKLGAFPFLVRAVGGVDAVVVSGTGLLENKRPIPGGDLVWLWLLGVAGLLRRVPISWFAIGGGRRLPLPARLVAASALRLTAYRSFRDVATPASLRSRVADEAAVIPDLVFARSSAAPTEPSPSRDGGLDGAVVGVAVIDYDQTDPAEEARYYSVLVDTVTELVDRGAEVRFLLGDSADVAPTERVRDAVVARTSGVVALTPFGAFGDILAAAGRCDAVVASRFHVLIAAVMAARPVVAVSHAAKDDTLLAQLGLERYCLPAATASAAEIVAAATDALADAPAISDALRRDAARFAQEVDRELTTAEFLRPPSPRRSTR